MCKRCFTHFNSCRYKSADEKLRQHLELCKSFEPVRCDLPKKESICFNNFEFSKKIRFVIYADFECILQPISHCKNQQNESWTVKYQKHKPFSYCYLLKDLENQYTQLRMFRGENASSEFMLSLLKDVKVIDKCLNAVKKAMPPLSSEQQKIYNDAQVCHICKKGNFTKKKI